MDRIARRSALATGAALALVACSDEAPQELDEEDDLSRYAPRLAEIAEEKRAVKAWLEEHRGALPSTYEEIIRLPSAYREPVALALSPIETSAILREHFRCVVRSRPDLTAEQRDVIAETSALISPAWITMDPRARGAVWLAGIGERVDRAFTLADRIRVFESIGPEDDGIRRRIADAAA